MTIDPTKIRPGDKVTVEARVTASLENNSVRIQFGNFSAIAPTSAIVSHTPAPREFKVGDRVRDEDGDEGIIRAIYKDQAWVYYCADYGDFVFPLSSLSHVEGEPG